MRSIANRRVKYSVFAVGMRIRILAAAVCAAASVGHAVERNEVAARLRDMSPEHPRVLLSIPAERSLKQNVANDPFLTSVAADVMAEADRVLLAPPVQRVLIGRRLLDKSRTALSRVLHLGVAWRLTGRDVYLQRAKAELVAVAGFADWNPSHFLDVAEMTTAVALGYDWFFAALDHNTRATLHTALVEKGLRPSLKSDSWTRVTNNWNQVCNAGMTIGALAIAESDPALAADIITRAINTVPRAMHEYVPDGAYPEGPGYWGYGTTFNVLLIAALEGAVGTDFGLSGQPGFLATADYYLHVVGPTGYYFNYADAGRGGPGLSPALFWFATKRREPALLWNQWAAFSGRTTGNRRGRDRTDPLVLLWATPGMQKSAPTRRSWSAGGPNPVAFHRSSWEPDATFVGVKGGSASLNHAHMDAGTFVIDADGQRWAEDLGMQDYNSLESKGVKLWDRDQNSERWSVFRLGSASHNVLRVDQQQQRVDGHAKLIVTKENRTVVQLTDIYAGQLANVRRGVSLQPDRTVRLQDEFTASARVASVRWAFVTRATVKIEGGTATLEQADKTLRLHVLEPKGAKLQIYPTDPPPSQLDASNEGTRMLGFELAATAGSSHRIVVQFVPGSATANEYPVTALATW